MHLLMTHPAALFPLATTDSARGTRGGPPMDVTGTTGVAAGTYDTMGQGSDATRKDNPNDMGAGAGYTGGAMGAIGVRTFEAPETRSNCGWWGMLPGAAPAGRGPTAVDHACIRLCPTCRCCKTSRFEQSLAAITNRQ